MAGFLLTFDPTAAFAAPDSSSADTNHDGKATMREVSWVLPNLRKRLFDRIEEDHKGLTGAVGSHDFQGGKAGGPGRRGHLPMKP